MMITAIRTFVKDVRSVSVVGSRVTVGHLEVTESLGVEKRLASIIQTCHYEAIF